MECEPQGIPSGPERSGAVPSRPKNYFVSFVALWFPAGRVVPVTLSYPEPWPDTWTLVSIDTRTPSTRPTLVSIDTPPTLLRHSSDTLRHSKPAIQTGRRAGRVYRVSIVSNSDTPTRPTRPTRPTLRHSTLRHAQTRPTQRSQDTGPAVPGHRSSGPRTQLPLHKCPIPLPSDVSQKSETTYCPILHKD